MIIRRAQNEKGASIAEAVTGLVVLIPIVLIIIDISALVLAQTANDDLAKHAARAAAGQSSTALRQQAANTVVNNYPGGSMTSAPTLVAYSESNSAQQVTVRTSIVCNLPVQVPFGGPKQQQFVAFDTEPIVSGLATANTGTSAPATGSNDWGQQDDLGFINVHLQTGPGGDPTMIGPLIPSLGEFSGSNGTTGSGNSQNNSSGSGSGNSNGSGSSDISVGGSKSHSGGSSGGGSSSGGSSSGGSSSGGSSSGGSSSGGSSSGGGGGGGGGSVKSN